MIAAPATQPVTLEEAKLHLRVEHEVEDTLISGLIAAAVAEIDGRHGYLRRALVTQTWELTLSRFPAARRIVLPMPPLQSVESVKYYDGANNEQTFDADNYEVVGTDEQGFVALNIVSSWPATYDREKAVTVRFVAGYGAAASVPANIRQAILLRVGDLYINRGDMPSDPDANLAVKRLLAPSRRVVLA
ncbi:Gene Transfer Agent (GTA) ORFG06 [Hyphomicrobium sulfonivorans]|uniref:Gene Transfer Agent (GTA) ORFG06 n=1 Tax=Hyphomicrobium sulfonivorans TaxID=121290 RepID=A0A120CYD8_HYPSL|nr:Gene Transfer Agent (GTA) ORFG06 [Hyphomicrobium sulfonivorans]